MSKAKKRKGNKICAAGIAWAKEPLIHIRQRMRIWQRASIVKILITLRG